MCIFGGITLEVGSDTSTEGLRFLPPGLWPRGNDVTALLLLLRDGGFGIGNGEELVSCSAPTATVVLCTFMKRDVIALLENELSQETSEYFRARVYSKFTLDNCLPVSLPFNS